jgi:hypothetical protein
MKLTRIVVIQTKEGATEFALNLLNKLGLSDAHSGDDSSYIRKQIATFIDIVDVRPILDTPISALHRDLFLVSDGALHRSLTNRDFVRTLAHVIAWKKTRIGGYPMTLFIEDTVSVPDKLPNILSLPANFDVCFCDDSFPFDGKEGSLPAKVGMTRSGLEKFCSAYFIPALALVKLIEHFTPVCCTLWKFAELCLNKAHLLEDYKDTQEALDYESIARRDIIFQTWHNIFTHQPSSVFDLPRTPEIEPEVEEIDFSDTTVQEPPTEVAI